MSNDRVLSRREAMRRGAGTGAGLAIFGGLPEIATPTVAAGHPLSRLRDILLGRSFGRVGEIVEKSERRSFMVTEITAPIDPRFGPEYPHDHVEVRWDEGSGFSVWAARGHICGYAEGLDAGTTPEQAAEIVEMCCGPWTDIGETA